MFIKKYALTLTITLSLTSPIALYSAQASTEKPETEQLRAMIAHNNANLLTTALKYKEFRDALAAFINEQDESGSTLLHKEAKRKSNISIAQILITNGADIKIQDANGDTPLHRGVKAGNVGFVNLLVNAGANKQLKNKLDKTPLEIAQKTLREMFCDSDSDYETAVEKSELYTAQASAEKPETKEVLYLKVIIAHNSAALLASALKLQKYRNALAAFINEQDESGSTLLHKEAKRKSNTSIAQILIANGADINIQDTNGRTPLFRAVMTGNANLAQLLIDTGALKGTNPEPKNDGLEPETKALSLTKP